jgi:hypothetical protein
VFIVLSYLLSGKGSSKKRSYVHIISLQSSPLEPLGTVSSKNRSGNERLLVEVIYIIVDVIDAIGLGQPGKLSAGGRKEKSGKETFGNLEKVGLPPQPITLAGSESHGIKVSPVED